MSENIKNKIKDSNGCFKNEKLNEKDKEGILSITEEEVNINLEEENNGIGCEIKIEP
ncbi:hypothetical protein UT300019_02680 [Clostridium sp. CTA-19]